MERDRHKGWRTFVINLAAAETRLKYVSEQLDRLGIDFTRVEAVDGRRLDYPIKEFSETSYRLLHGRRRCPPEIGCYLSHIKCIELLLESGSSHALILEDDVALPDDLVAIVEAAIARGGEWDILRLSTVSSGRNFPYSALTEGRDLAVSLVRKKGSGAYVLNRRAAEVFRARLLPIRVAWDIAYDTEYLYGLRSAFVSPVPVNQVTDLPSQIQANIRTYRLPWWRYFSVFPFRAYLETARVCSRSLRLLRMLWRHRKETIVRQTSSA